LLYQQATDPQSFAHGSPFFFFSAIVVFALFRWLAGEMSGKLKNLTAFYQKIPPQSRYNHSIGLDPI